MQLALSVPSLCAPPSPRQYRQRSFGGTSGGDPQHTPLERLATASSPCGELRPHRPVRGLDFVVIQDAPHAVEVTRSCGGVG